MQLETFTRVFLPVYFVFYFAVAFLWRSYLVWKRTGVNPVVFSRTDNAHDLIGWIFKLVFAATAGAVLVYALAGRSYSYLAPIDWLERPVLKVIGLLLLLPSFVWTAAAQAQMGASWRIGIDAERKTALVRHGIFRLSRNPIFLGMMATLLGLFFVAPNALTLLIVGLGVALIQIQVRLEEEHLSRLHNSEYEKYRSQVRRWL